MVQQKAKAKKPMHVYESKGEPLFQAILIFLFVLLGVTFVYPYWHTVVVSFTHSDYTGVSGFHLWPLKECVDSYVHLLTRSPHLWTGYRSTLIVCGLGLLVSMAGVIFAAYPLSKKDLPFRGLFTSIIVVTMFISGGMIPTYLLVANTLKLKDTYWAVILPQAISAYNIVIARNFFMGLPVDLEEAATIDGANSFQVLLRIILPLSMPILATIGLWVTVGNWNAYFNCMLYIKNPDRQVLQLVLREIINNSGSEAMTGLSDSLMRTTGMDETNMKAVAIVVSTLPILCVYPFVQKYFVKGVLVGSVKG